MPDGTNSEVYSLGDAQAQSSYVSGRRSERWVGFLLPHLRPGFSVLDCGCGTGSITLDLAAVVAPGQVVGVDADAAQLERAFANLLENARRYGGGLPISVNARRAGDRVVVSVVDQGPGIPPAEQQRIFEPFYRAPADGDDAHAGSGLGLAIAKGFIETNGGRIRVESVRGEGATFIVELPLVAGSDR